jgi:hypothetical protein
MEGMGLGIALTSYAGTMGIGFNADPDIISDLELFIRRFEQALKAIADVAGVTLGPISDDVNKVQATID